MVYIDTIFGVLLVWIITFGNFLADFLSLDSIDSNNLSTADIWRSGSIDFNNFSTSDNFRPFTKTLSSNSESKSVALFFVDCCLLKDFPVIESNLKIQFQVNDTLLKK